MMNNEQSYDVAKQYLGNSGSVFRSYCGLGKSDPYCNAFVSYIFYKTGNKSLYCEGSKEVYCPHSINWCYDNLANIPPYLALPMDVVYFDWELNGTPNHIGFARERKSADVLLTLEGNTSGGKVDTKSRNAKYIQAVFRPHFKATYKIAKLDVDGYFGYNSIAMLQKVLGVDVDGILGKITVKALQKAAGTEQDGSWGPKTSKAVQKLVGAEVDGLFGEKSVKALQRWINANVTIPAAEASKEPVTQPQTPVESDKLVVDGVFGKVSITKAQQYFGTLQDGEISGQLKKLQSKLKGIDSECIGWGGGGSTLIKAIQIKLGASSDGIIGVETNKAIQTWLGITVDGIWGAETSKAFQVFLNDPTKNPPHKVVVETWQDKANAWAKKIAADNSYHYKRWVPKDGKTHICPICNNQTADKYHGWNCIGFAFAIWHHGGKLPTPCNCHVIADGTGTKMLAVGTDAEALKIAKKYIGTSTIEVIRNKNGIPKSQWKKGDIGLMFSGNTFKHMFYYMGDGKIADSTSSGSLANNIAVRSYKNYSAKVIIRYTGK